MRVYIKEAGAGDVGGSYSFDFDNTVDTMYYAVDLLRISGADMAYSVTAEDELFGYDYWDSYVYTQNAATPSITTGADDALVLRWAGSDDFQETLSGPSGYTDVSTHTSEFDSPYNIRLMEDVQTSAGVAPEEDFITNPVPELGWTGITLSIRDGSLGCLYCASMTLPEGVTMHKASDDSLVTLGSIGETPTEVYLEEDGEKVATFTLAQNGGVASCEPPSVDTDTTNYQSLVHDFAEDLLQNYTGKTYTLHVPKSGSHNQVRVCSGKSTIGCTDQDSWSFVANSSGTITSTNGGFDTSGITVSQDGSLWTITGLTGTSAQGESGGASVPEFSLWAVLLMLGAATYVFQRKTDILHF